MIFKRTVIYARISVNTQSTSNQVLELREAAQRLGWTVAAELIDARTDSKGPAFDRLLAMIRRHEIDLVMASDLSRLGKSLRELVAFMDEIRRSGVQLYIPGVLDTQSHEGQIAVGVFTALKDCEKQLASERIKVALQEARRSGRKLGRPSVADTPGVKAAVRVLRERGFGIRRIARELRIGCDTTQRILAAPDI
jgi:DNA invertase Pin-like site-specific DNA recombinase